MEQPEYKAPVDADAQPRHRGTRLKTDCADKCGGFSGGEASEHRHGCASDLTRDVTQTLVEISREVDKTDRVGGRRILWQEQLVFSAVLHVRTGPVRRGWRLRVQFFDVLLRFFVFAAKSVAFVMNLLQVVCQRADLATQ